MGRRGDDVIPIVRTSLSLLALGPIIPSVRIRNSVCLCSINYLIIVQHANANHYCKLY